jgi:amidohydrolase
MELNLKTNWYAAAEGIHTRVVAHRRHLHAHPELSFAEHATSDYVAASLQKIGIEFTRGWCKSDGGAGIVAEIHGQASSTSRHIALRADLDALPICELPGPSYISQNEGTMHACGHDAHTACLLGAAELLHNSRSQWSGTVRLIFQPGEERLPGGASIMAAEGALDSATSIAAQHVYPELRAGQLGFRSGPYMAATDEIYITVQSPGGHGALPQTAPDPIVAAAHLILALQSVVSRMRDPLSPGVLTIGKIQGGQAGNVIPSEVKLAGTLRSYDESWRDRAHADIERIAQATCSAHGTTAQVELKRGYPAVVNDPDLTARCRAIAVNLVGEKNVVDLPQRMTGEDFSFYQRLIPGCFYRLGTGGDDPRTRSGLHTPGFDIDEKALITGTAMLAALGAGL